MKTSTQLVLSLLVCLVLGALLVTFINHNKPAPQAYSLYHGGKRVLDSATGLPFKFTVLSEKNGNLRVRREDGKEIIVSGDYVLEPYNRTNEALFKYYQSLKD